LRSEGAVGGFLISAGGFADDSADLFAFAAMAKKKLCAACFGETEEGRRVNGPEVIVQALVLFEGEERGNILRFLDSDQRIVGQHGQVHGYSWRIVFPR
jgi:hypothetical protein